MSSPVIIKSKIETAVANAAVDVMRQVAAGAEPSNARVALKATEVAARVTADPAISTALEPLPRVRSETLQGIVVAGAGWFLQATGLGETTTIALELLGYDPDPAKVSTVLSTVLTVAASAGHGSAARRRRVACPAGSAPAVRNRHGQRSASGMPNGDLSEMKAGQSRRESPVAAAGMLYGQRDLANALRELGLGPAPADKSKLTIRGGRGVVRSSSADLEGWPMSKLDPEHEIIAAHMAATTAAFQVLVHCLQENGALEHGQFQLLLAGYMERTKDQASPVMLLLLDDLRQALMN